MFMTRRAEHIVVLQVLFDMRPVRAVVRFTVVFYFYRMSEGKKSEVEIRRENNDVMSERCKFMGNG